MKKLLLMAAAALTALSGWCADGFYTQGTKLMDANGKELLIRGVNYSWTWQRGHEYSAIPAAKRMGSNTIRIQINDKGTSKCKPEDLERLIKLCEENKLVAIFNTHDETGKNPITELQRAADFWIEMKDIMNAHRKTVLLNISNEWYGDWKSDPWAEGYLDVIPKMRAAGIKNTLIVDCAGYGQYPQSVIERGADVLAADPDRNLVFSYHVYDQLGNTAAKVRYSIDAALALNAPLIIGEFAYNHNDKPVAYKTVMNYCHEKNVGWLVWSWSGNSGGTEACDMFKTYDETYMMPNGTATVLHEYGLKNTGKQCSIFGPETPVVREYKDFEIVPEEEMIFTPDFKVTKQFDAKYFPNVRVGDKIRVHYTALPDAAPGACDIQIVYKKAITWAWTQFDAKLDVTKNVYEHEISDADFRDGLIWGGLTLKGGNFKLDKIEVVASGHDVTFDPAPVPELDPSEDPDYEEEAEELVTVSEWMLDTPFEFTDTWKKEYNIKQDKFANAQVGHTIRLFTEGMGQMQFALKDEDWTWLQLVNCVDLMGDHTDLKITDNETAGIDGARFLELLKLRGLIVKGRSCTLKGMALMKPAPGGVEGVGTDNDAMIDWNLPMDIYTIQGVKVQEMIPGGMYVVRQNGNAFKICK